MAGYSIDLYINPKFEQESKDFLEFMRKVGRKYPVTISYRKVNKEKYYLTIDGTPGGKIDSLYQELILNKGLYYYGCSLKNRTSIINNVITPIYSQFIYSRFENDYCKLLKRHIFGTISENFLPGDFHNTFCHQYEILYRKWDIGIVSNYDFIKDLDYLLTNFLLNRLNYSKGDKSPAYEFLVEKGSLLGPVMDKGTKKKFKKIHELRTKGLHRMENELSRGQISELASFFFWYFQYFEEFDSSQKQKTTKLTGKRYRRITYGKERYEDNGEIVYIDSSTPCHDCGTIAGQYHTDGCDMEECPRCHGQYLGCECKTDRDFD